MLSPETGSVLALKNRVQHLYELYAGSIAPGHGLDHVERVEGWGRKIAHELNYDRPDFVEAAIVLHDVGRLSPHRNSNNHAWSGAETARQELGSHATNFSPDEQEEILVAIREHSRPNASTLLGQIVQDADRLDGLGVIGLIRASVTKGQTIPADPAKIEQDYNRDPGPSGLKTLVDQLAFQRCWAEMMNTDAGRRLAEPLVANLDRYIQDLTEQIQASRS